MSQLHIWKRSVWYRRHNPSDRWIRHIRDTSFFSTKTQNDLDNFINDINLFNPFLLKNSLPFNIPSFILVSWAMMGMGFLMLCYLSMLLIKERSSFSSVSWQNRSVFFGQRALLVVRFYRFECLSRPEFIIMCYVLQSQIAKEIGLVILHFVIRISGSIFCMNNYSYE
jgi:hypothetical protein